MKTFALIYALLLYGITANAQTSGSIDALNEKYGFRTAHFEALVSDFKDLLLVDNGKLTKGYIRRGDSKKIGGASIERIVYYFYKGQLSHVAIATNGLANSKALLEALIAQYGEPEESRERLEKYFWSSSRVMMAYDGNLITHDAIVMISSKPVAWQKKEDDATAAKKAASDL